MRIHIDPQTGLHAEDGTLVQASDSPERVAMILGADHQLEGNSSVVSRAVTLADCPLRLEARFRGEKLASIRLCEGHPEALPSAPTENNEMQAAIESTLRSKALLASLLGPPGYENARGALYSYAWGFLYAQSSIALLYPGIRAPVPLPRPAPRGFPLFRCMSCGHLMDLGYGSHILEVPSDRGGAPCEACGSIRWVQAGSTTEFYRYSQKPWVCEVGMHPAEGVKLFRIFPPASYATNPPDERAPLRIESLLVKACPAHVEHLRRGFLGCTLPEGAQGEAPP